jgi:hypothetical protein
VHEVFAHAQLALEGGRRGGGGSGGRREGEGGAAGGRGGEAGGRGGRLALAVEGLWRLGDTHGRVRDRKRIPFPSSQQHQQYHS